MDWRKSSYSDGNGGSCVEAASANGVVLVRDTKQHGCGPVVRVTPDDWRRLTESLR